VSTLAFERVRSYLREKSTPSFERRLVFFKRRVEPYYGVPIRAGLTHAEVEAFQIAHSVRLPEEVRDNYFVMDGMDDYTDMDASFFRFMPLSSWTRVGVEFPTEPSSHQEPLSTSFTCADHSICAWFYAVDLDPSRLGRIYSIEEGGHRQVASTFEAFVAAVMSNSDILFESPAD